ncbi:MAG TPA: hypothetical protein PLB48_12780, partial [Treponema sp.]|nr:hypothetical protein [Treponema sp.]HRS05276.1 hypothetical protein [Treponema sp.]
PNFDPKPQKSRNDSSYQFTLTSGELGVDYIQIEALSTMMVYCGAGCIGKLILITPLFLEKR